MYALTLFSGRHILSLFLILGILTASISPACKFISGQAAAFIEICTAQGLEKIAVPKEQAPADKPHQTFPSCVFCFASHAVKAMTAHAPALVNAPQPERLFAFSLKTPALTGSSAIIPEARAPPVTV